MNILSRAFLCVVAVVTANSSLSARQWEPSAQPYKETTEVESDFPFVKGARELELGLGAFWSVGTTGDAKRPDMSFGLAQVSHGWMLSDVRGSGALRGNFEFLLGVFGGSIWDGPGDGLIGSNLLLRYNFVQSGAVVVPFVQIGGGGVYSDAAKDDKVQQLIGSEMSFNLEGAIGVRWMLSNRCAVSLRAEYRHLSNANLADRNSGLNVIGGVLGVSWFF